MSAVEYVSTRGEGDPQSYGGILLEGLAQDGGLYRPRKYPQVSQDQLRELSALSSYEDLFRRIKGLFIGDSFDLEAQQEFARAAYSEDKFPNAVDGNIVPIRQIGENLFVQNLSGGPTAAFKDMAMQPLGQEMSYELARRSQHLRILGATSGDTGSAAESAFKGMGGVTLFMLSPLSGMSDFQREQMGSLTGDNVHNLAVDGRFDDLQKMVKALKGEDEFKDLGAVNSINWGRIASQIPYYFSGYLQAVGDNIGQEVDFVVPSGNMGNALAGHVARAMGLPIRNIVIATNENSVLHDLIQTGVYKKGSAKITSSPSMDIAEASNAERIFSDMFYNSPLMIRLFMQMFKDNGRVSLRDVGFGSKSMKSHGFDSGASNHEKRLATIRRVYDDTGTFIDPHTADGVGVAYARARGSGLEVPTICMETALPVKFEPTIEEALGIIPEREDRFKQIGMNPNEGFVVIGSIDALRKYIRQHSRNLV